MIEHSPEALSLQREFFSDSGVPIQETILSPQKIKKHSLGLYSYSLTEMSELPEEITRFDALMLIEPSTQEDGRRLLEFRKQLLTEGYFAWAPCLHQEACPLLTHSKTDWCHHKFIPILPEWLKKVSARLPMQTGEILSLSYLLMKKAPAPAVAPGLTRVIGDPLKEKGKARQLICRGPEREFLSWLRRDFKKPEFFSRHDLIEAPEDAQKAGNEIRVSKNNLPKMAD